MSFSKDAGTSSGRTFYALCFAFQDNSVCLQSINDSYITLIPKIDGAQQVGDFRPISVTPSVGAESDQQVNICSFAIRYDRRWPSTQ